MSNHTSSRYHQIPSLESINSAISSVAIDKFSLETQLTDLFEISSSISNVMEVLSEHMEMFGDADRRVLIFSLNLAKDIAIAKAVTIACTSSLK